MLVGYALYQSSRVVGAGPRTYSCMYVQYIHTIPDGAKGSLHSTGEEREGRERHELHFIPASETLVLSLLYTGITS